ncbi:MAG: undecaprenyl-phosphate glucose phosphotransferase, partial [Clostridia bacterium]|nr:undecaprenyl-phosphate glucose phosphotransferase [Clostridia bacterium]
MIKENQKIFNQINVIIEGCLILLSMVLAYYLRLFFLENKGDIMALRNYLLVAVCLVPLQLVIYKMFGLYGAQRKKRFVKEIAEAVIANSIGLMLVLVALFVVKE